MMPMNDPVIMPDGYTYEKEAIRIALEKKPISTMARQKMTINEAISNRALKQLIQDSLKKPKSKYSRSNQDYNYQLTNEQLQARIYEPYKTKNKSCILYLSLNGFNIVGHKTICGYTYFKNE